MNNLGALKLGDTYIDLQIGSNKKKFYYIWLRDNCRCNKCFNTFLNQIVIHLFNIPLRIKPKKCETTNEKLLILWDDGHTSEYSLKWLNSTEFAYKSKIETFIWDHKVVDHLNELTVPVDNFFEDMKGVQALAKTILKYGFGFVSGVEISVDATEKVVKHFAMIQKSLYGEMWHISSNSDFNDNGATNVALFPHTDNTYLTDAAGLQVFHLMHHDGEGGNTLLVDGFNIANIIKNKKPEAFETLCKVPVKSHFIDKTHHFICTAPVVKLHPVTKELYQIRYNIYDRSPLTSVKNEDILKFYEAFIMFGKEIDNIKNQYSLKLQPGTVVFIDNWRMLHGRTEYTGQRDLAGCYISKDNFINTVKRAYPEFQ